MRQYRAKLEMKRTYKPKLCACGVEFTPKGPASLRCSTCAKSSAQDAREKAYFKYAKKRGINYGAGTGNHNSHHKGKDSKCYSSGTGEYVRARVEMLAELKCCERCNKDLQTVGSFERVIHHRDHNRSNNERINLELLCKRCHQIEHECFEHFLNV